MAHMERNCPMGRSGFQDVWVVKHHAKGGINTKLLVVVVKAFLGYFNPGYHNTSCLILEIPPEKNLGTPDSTRILIFWM